MASWDELLNSLKEAEQEKKNEQSALDKLRADSVRRLAEIRKREVVCYYSGWLQTSDPTSSVSISDDDMNGFMSALHGLDKTKGLDLVLHTPGGGVAAAESIAKYLKSFFDDDIVVIVPQLAMSAGTMIACASKEIIMGRQSSLGPTDPQFRGVAAAGVVEEFQKAIEEVEANPSSLPLWSLIISQYNPTFLGDCQKAIAAAESIVKTWLETNMFKGETDAKTKAETVARKLCSHEESAMHERHYSVEDLKLVGLKIKELEDNGNDDLQDAVLTLHHSFMLSFQTSNALKIIESSNGKKWIKAGAL